MVSKVTYFDKWSEWSMFEWMCLIQIVRQEVFKWIKIFEIFVITDNPQEAEILLRTIASQDVASDKLDRSQNEHVRNLVNDYLFEKGAVKLLFKNHFISARLSQIKSI
mmetsp:Transcript_14011/g.23800  ORF Transcript_14011/g.23800 Transcript_14011/m.23800 type:complete len:108 (-) Transcript_14011:889-1212(-)